MRTLRGATSERATNCTKSCPCSRIAVLKCRDSLLRSSSFPGGRPKWFDGGGEQPTCQLRSFFRGLRIWTIFWIRAKSSLAHIARPPCCSWRERSRETNTIALLERRPRMLRERCLTRGVVAFGFRTRPQKQNPRYFRDWRLTAIARVPYVRLQSWNRNRNLPGNRIPC